VPLVALMQVKAHDQEFNYLFPAFSFISFQTLGKFTRFPFMIAEAFNSM
jgi:hypothetical protein